MYERAGVIIIKEGKILLMHRKKHGEEYFVVPGGGVEVRESPEEAARREAKEETGLTAETLTKLWEYPDRDGRNHHYYLVTGFSGDVMLGGEEAFLHGPHNSYQLRWVPVADIPHLQILSPEVKRRLIEYFSGFDFRV